MSELQTRRKFFTTASMAVASMFSLTKSWMRGLAQAPEPSRAGQSVPEGTFHVFTAQDIAGMLSTLQDAPGNKNLFSGRNIGLSATLTVETRKTAPEFEYHEHRDHLIQVMNGSTRYLVGGTPTGQHQTGPGEWLASESIGATTIELKKGDVLLLPRNTPHKRITDSSVSFLMVNGTAAQP